MRLLFTLPLILLLVAGCETQSASPSTSKEKEVNVPFTKHGNLDLLRGNETYLTLDIEIAEGDSAITRGLMQRTSMPDKSGMLFLMPEERVQSFWMSNTLISLDIIFINSNMEIVHIAKYTAPLSQESVSSAYPANYILEVIAGFTDSQGILEGDMVSWQRNE